LYFKRSSSTLNGFLFLILCTSLTINYGKYGFALFIAPGINTYALISAVIMIPGFSGGFPAIEYPADFEFPLRRDKGGILENS
jgi:hypothetical protein